MIKIEAVQSAQQRNEFIDFAWQIYRDIPPWVPPLRMDLRRMLDPRRGDYFRHGNSGQCYLARREGVVVGRVGAFRNEAHLRAQKDGAGFFGFFESIDDPAVADALLAAAADWLREHGLAIMRGPANFNVQEESGVLLDGFEHQPMTGMGYTPPYYRRLMETAGLRKVKDLYVYRMERTGVADEQLDRISAVASRRQGLVVRPIRLHQLPDECRRFARIFAEAWRGNWGLVPISATEFEEAYKRYRHFVVPELTLIAEVDGEPAGCALVMPDMNVLLKRLNGRLTLRGLWELWRGRRKIDRYRFFIAGVLPAHRRLGLPIIFIQRIRRILEQRGAQLLELSWVLEDNHEVIGLARRVGARRVQTLRIYGREL